MENLVIQENNNEYFLNDRKLYFLENIGRINLFIGANNTRKSRFLRKIIEAEGRTIVDADKPINAIYLEGLSLVEEIEHNFKDSLTEELLSVTTTNYPPQEDKKFYDVNSYFENKRADNDRAINFKVILEHLKNINTSLIDLRVTDHITRFKEEIKLVFSVVDMLTYLYYLKDKDPNVLSGYLTYPNTWPEENLNAYAFRFADGQGHAVTNQKAATLKKTRQYLHALVDIEVIPSIDRLIYIPVLRSARALIQDNGSVMYEDVLRNAVHQQHFNGKLANKGEQIYTAQLFYDGVKRQKNGSSTFRSDFKAFEKFVGENFFQSADLEITALHSESGKKEITIDLPGERKDVPIHDLGDGVQAIINLLFPVFTAREGSWIFIDEPELNLHPGFQNLFIRTVIENSFLRDKKLRYFINSHSNHILSEALLSGSEDTETFVFSRRDKDSSNIQPFKGYEAATLELLGVLNTSTLLSNCSVWVEGITDRLYIRAFLTAYLKQITGYRPIEGLNYTFIEYGGSNLKHYLFDTNPDESGMERGIKAYFVNNKIFLISDKDFTKDKQHQYYETLNKKNFQYEHTRYPEIENLIPPEILFSFLQIKLKVPEAVAKEITSHSYKHTKLGKFLTSHFDKHNITIKIAAKTGGTLATNYKLMLAEFVFNQVAVGNFNWDAFKEHEVIADIIPKLYKFIHLHNK